MQKATCVIIGAGVIGCSIAYHLAKLGLRDTVLLEKDFIASKATGICPGGIRQQWSSELGCLLSRASIEFFKHFLDELHPGFPLKFVQSGYLFLAYSEKNLRTYQENTALQHHFGIPSEILTPREIGKLVPGIEMKGILGAAYCREDGYIEDCSGFTNILASWAREMGARIIYDEAREILLTSGRIGGIKGKRETYECEVVVNAAGCDSPGLAASIGVDLPILPAKRRLLYTQKIEDHFLDPCIATLEKGWGGKQLSEGHVYIAYIGEDAEALSNYEFTVKSVELGTEIIPRLGDVGVHRLQEGYYDMTPDGNPILGRAEGIEGYYHAVGFSGHGFMLSPAIGKAVAQLVMGKTPFVDLTPWTIDRFKEKTLKKEGLIL